MKVSGENYVSTSGKGEEEGGAGKKVEGWRKRSEVGRPSVMERLQVFMNRSPTCSASTLPASSRPFLFLRDQGKGHQITIHHHMLISRLKSSSVFILITFKTSSYVLVYNRTLRVQESHVNGPLPRLFGQVIVCD